MSIEKFNPRISNELIPYTQVNTQVIQNISNVEAGFVWIYLLSLPKDWQVIKQHIKNKYKFGDDKISRIFAYLRRSNLIEYIRERDSCGMLRKVEIRVLNGSKFVSKIPKCTPVHAQQFSRAQNENAQEISQENINEINAFNDACTTTSKTTGVENHGRGKPGTTKNINNKGNKKHKLNISRASYDAQNNALKLFEIFWLIYPIKKNKKRAVSIWLKKNLYKLNDHIVADVKNKILNDHQWQDKRFIPHPDTYLNNDRWTDEIVDKSSTISNSGNNKTSAFSNFISKTGNTYDEHGRAINTFDQ